MFIVIVLALLWALLPTETALFAHWLQNRILQVRGTFESNGFIKQTCGMYGKWEKRETGNEVSPSLVVCMYLKFLSGGLLAS